MVSESDINEINQLNYCVIHNKLADIGEEQKTFPRVDRAILTSVDLHLNDVKASAEQPVTDQQIPGSPASLTENTEQIDTAAIMPIVVRSTADLPLIGWRVEPDPGD